MIVVASYGGWHSSTVEYEDDAYPYEGDDNKVDFKLGSWAQIYIWIERVDLGLCHLSKFKNFA